MKKYLCTIFLTSLMSFGAAQAQNVKNAIVGVGAFTCGDWTEARSGRGTPILASATETWAQGYLSGSNQQYSAEYVTLPSVSTINAYLENYCRQYPLKRIHEGLGALYAQLAKEGVR
ncbi:hypothetical protein QTI05_24220 [Variovorax sp. J22R193]|uniref:hypothetical protein n=1 Tax=Variovorax fucosicus TaxID=3053517 RepID=UPI002578B716|nr:hypothetical protein [Variovorax sp. J22R193]MDM0042166.1 hypothetical protein [Variovorax sp. J22R193]